MAIAPFQYIDSVATNWSISIDGTGTKRKENPSKLQVDPPSRNCQIIGCTERIRINSSSGLCSSHKLHTADLILSVNNSGTILAKIPSHGEIIELLIDWAQSRNYRLEPFFEGLSFNILGNIPDVSTLDGMTPLSSLPHVNINLLSIFNQYALKVVDQFFPTNNNASYQLLTTRYNVAFPARILAVIFASLVLCEESNRGDRWFYRNITQDETQTKMLGGAMPLAYFAARRFNWGVEMKSVLPRIF